MMAAMGKYVLFPKLLLVVLCSVSLGSCATYYERNLKFQSAFESGNLEEADRILSKNEKAAEGKNRLLYFMQRGVVLQMLGEFEKSNEHLEQAYIFLEDYKRNYGYDALMLVSNPMMKPYAGEDHEKVLIHYYKALNYLHLQEPEKALVEARRINNRLNLLNLQYEDRKNRYEDDAFAHILMGLAYELDGDVNNAFIAYRNAYETYKNLYSDEFGVQAPEQLKQDLLRTAYLNGFRPDLEHYEKEFGVEYKHQPRGEGELVFFWHNGLGPVKDEWSINFTVLKGKGGAVTFVNEEYGINIPFPAAKVNDKDAGGIGDLKIVRVAFPKYQSRQPYFHSAKLVVDSSATYEVEIAENLDRIATSVLEDRMLREMGSALLRLATKQAAEEAARRQNQDIGAVISIINAATEKADTRNWQTLPHSIGYARILLSAGTHRVELATKAEKHEEREVFEFEIEKGGTEFHMYHSLGSRTTIR